MPNPNSLNFTCDYQFAVNLKASRKGTCGYLLDFSGLGGLSLRKDIEVWNPYAGAGQTVIRDDTIKCIGLVESFGYEGGETDPIRIKCYVSKGTASEIRAKLARPLSNVKLKLSWYIIAFDEDSKLWHEAAFVKVPSQADAIIDTVGGELQIFIANQPTKADPTLDINLFAFEFQVVPADNKNAKIEFATAPTQKLVKQWGESG
jgi:hypothetical protein